MRNTANTARSPRVVGAQGPLLYSLVVGGGAEAWMGRPELRAVGRGLLVVVLAAGLSVAATAPVLAAPVKPAPTGRDPFSRGMELYRQGKLDDALAMFHQAEAAEPSDPLVQ